MLGGDCTSRECLGGVCCNRACSGICAACNSATNGVCMPVLQQVCRPASGECDAEEVCSDASGLMCPDDQVKSDGSPCSTGHCKAGVCTTDPVVPADAGQAQHIPIAPTDLGPAQKTGCGCDETALAPTFGVALAVLLRRRRR